MVLGTGASGHVGGAVVSRLAPLGHDVVAMVRDVHTPLVMHHASCIIFIDHTWLWRRGDALHVAAIRRCLGYATL